MAGTYTVIPKDTFDGLQMDTGVFLKNFDPENPGRPQDTDIVCATTGGINISVTPNYSDFFEDVDNAPNNMKEGLHLDGWDIKVTTTALSTSPEMIKTGFGAADIVDGNKIVPRTKLKDDDFTDRWWVGDKANGGLVAAHFKNLLSTGGFQLQTGKNVKGTIPLEFTAHPDLAHQDEVPVTFYSIDPPTQTPSTGA
jgi:hypothetical protein